MGRAERIRPRPATHWRVRIKELGSFGTVGVLCFILDVSLFQVLYAHLGARAVTAKLLATAVSTTVAYLAHRHWSFAHRAGSRPSRAYPVFVAVNGATLLLNLGVVALVRYPLGQESPLVLQAANVAGIALGTGIRYLAYCRWVFPAVEDRAVPPPVTAGGPVVTSRPRRRRHRRMRLRIGDLPVRQEGWTHARVHAGHDAAGGHRSVDGLIMTLAPEERRLRQRPTDYRLNDNQVQDLQPVQSPETLELTVLLPCLNEAETLDTCIRKARRSMRELSIRGEVVVADNGSTDGSQAIAEAAGARVVPVSRRGYGAAIRGGIEAARGRYVLMADADDSYALDDLEPFVRELRAGAQLVMGNRFMGGIAPGAMPALHRYLGNPVLSWAGRRFFRVPIRDFHCGMRAFDREAIRGLGMMTDGMEFASETVVRSALAGLRITEVPTTLRPDGRSRPPHLRTWVDGWRHLRFLLAFSPRWLFLYPALATMAVGLLGLTLLSAGTIEVGGVSFGIHTMLACATLVILGLQVGGTALVARAYAWRLKLLPRSPGLEQWLERITLERGLLLGLVSVLLGIGAFGVALATWGAAGFGQLDPVATLRLPIIGMVLVVGGTQIAVSAFAVSLTGVGQDAAEDMPAPAIEPNVVQDAPAEATEWTATGR